MAGRIALNEIAYSGTRKKHEEPKNGKYSGGNQKIGAKCIHTAFSFLLGIVGFLL